MSELSGEVQELRAWQRDLVEIFEQAVLPATEHINSLIASGIRGDELEKKLNLYYSSINRPQLSREKVWSDGSRIESKLLSPPVNGKRFLRAQFQAATGAGKTRALEELIKSHLKNSQSDAKEPPPVYIVVEPKLELVKQAYKSLSKIPNIDCFCACSSIDSAPTKNKNETVRAVMNRSVPLIVITTKQSSAGYTGGANGLLSMLHKAGALIDIIFFDEVHLLAGEAEGKIQKEAPVWFCDLFKLKISLTATPSAIKRPDGPFSNGLTATHKTGEEGFYCQNATDGVFGPILVRYTYKDALEDGVVAPIRLVLMDNTIPMGDPGAIAYFKSITEEWDKRNASRMTWPFFHGGNNVDILDATTEKQRPEERDTWRSERLAMITRILYEFAVGNQTRVIAFCSARTLRAKKLTGLMKWLCVKVIQEIEEDTCPWNFHKDSVEHRRLKALSSNCYYEVSGSKSCMEHQNGLQAFRDSQIGFLTTVDKISEGADIPGVTGIFFPDIKGKSNRQKLIQCLGRGTRISEGKSFCDIFLPCFVPNIFLSLDEEASRPSVEALSKLSAENNWRGTFSMMALVIYQFLCENNPSRQGVLQVLPIQSIEQMQFSALNKARENTHQLPESNGNKESSMRQPGLRIPSEISRRFRHGTGEQFSTSQ